MTMGGADPVKGDDNNDHQHKLIHYSPNYDYTLKQHKGVLIRVLWQS